MALNRNHARPLLTDAEYDLFTSSLSDRIGELDAPGLTKAIARTRRARDKAADQHRRQATKVRDTSGARGAARSANVRTEKKATALGEALERFEKRLAAVEAAEEKARRKARLDAARPAPKAKKPAGNRQQRRAGGAEGFMSSSAQAEAETSRRAPQTRISSSRAAAGRRRQARRDG
jgi:hypothetical protein